MSEVIELESLDEARALFGPRDRYLKLIRERYGVAIVARSGILRLEGADDAVREARTTVLGLRDRIRRGDSLTPDMVHDLVSRGAPGDAGTATNGGRGSDSGRLPAQRFLPKTSGQQRYMDVMQKNDIVFCSGPAGTGKTFLAVVAAVARLKDGTVRKLILVRPAVEAGEKLGFLPGDFQAKINPYLRPLYDALHEVLDYDTVRKYLEREIIEIVPLAYMRGRTLNRSFIILDEGQNTTKEQMKMFLTRMGEGSRIVVTGDTTQTDLPQGKSSGLLHAQRILHGVDGIAVHEMSVHDIVRHPLVWKIVNAYDGKSAKEKE